MAKIRIFRLTLAADTKDTEFIDFNTSKNTKIENAFITEIKENPSDGVGNNQGAELPLGDQQALDQIEDIYRITGFFSKRNGDSNDGMNSYLTTLRQWINEAKIVDDVWELGRFGLLLMIIIHKM